MSYVCSALFPAIFISDYIPMTPLPIGSGIVSLGDVVALVAVVSVAILLGGCTWRFAQAAKEAGQNCAGRHSEVETSSGGS